MRFYTVKSLALFVFLLCAQFSQAQNCFSIDDATGNVFRIQLTNPYCECHYAILSQQMPNPSGISFCPDGTFLANYGTSFYSVDTFSGSLHLIFSGLDTLTAGVEGLACTGTDRLYFATLGDSSKLYLCQPGLGTVEYLGNTGYKIIGDMTLYQGDIYAPVMLGDLPDARTGIILIDTITPSNSPLVTILVPDFYDLEGLTASPLCNTLIGLDDTGENIVLINLIDGAVTVVCPLEGQDIDLLASAAEQLHSLTCQNHLDLDCNDSSGALGGDYNSSDYTCFTDFALIADEDVRLFFDANIHEMTIQLTGFIPDAPFERLWLQGGVSNIQVSGNGTTMITLTSIGAASAVDYINALHQIRYVNNATPLTGGLRTVKVKFSTFSFTISNIATAFINVQELPFVTVNLGPDLTICEDSSVVLNAGNAGASFSWSTGQHTQTINVNAEGDYIVTVSASGLCPNQDTIHLEVLPVVEVSLSGDHHFCSNESVEFTIHVNTSVPLDFIISATPGDQFSFSGITDNVYFMDDPDSSTTYTLTDLYVGEEACIDISDSTHSIVVYPAYEQMVDTVICEGDSIWLGYDWVHTENLYVNEFPTIHNCDSVITTDVIVAPAVHANQSSTTCHASEAGTFITHLNNLTGCDTILTTLVSLIPSDTTKLSIISCRLSDTGISMQTLSNHFGCDSVIITTTNYVPPVDSTYLIQSTCDSSLLGSFQQRLSGMNGCDSLVITDIVMAPGDTAYVTDVSCDPASIGTFQNLFSNQNGCDSLVITTVSAGIPDTAYLPATSCDSASLGVFEMHFNSILGCDSVIFTTISYSAHDSTFISSASCDPNDVGVFIQSLVNKYGCDSIVTQTVALLPTNEMFISSTTCNPSASGVFVHSLTNQFGCDSTVTETISLLPSDETFLSATTCLSSQAGTFITSHFNQYGCDSLVTLTVSLITVDTTTLYFKTCDPAQVGSTQNIFTNQDGCDSLLIEQTSLYPLPDLQVLVTSDFNGYDISCFGEANGSVTANINGVAPYSYSWSTGDTDQSITGLLAGSYAVTVTDGNGCVTNGTVTLFDPAPFIISFEVSQPDCFDKDNGSITVKQTGGVSPFRYSIDGINYQSSPTFSGLSGGTYQVTALDANGCEDKEFISIKAPLAVNVELGDDQIIMPGDTSIINAIINVPYDSLASITWSGLINPDCPTCLTQHVTPNITTTYSVSVTSIDGCKDEDEVTVFIERKNEIYIPNVFSPNGDGINDRLVISAGDIVEEITSFMIYDRWGNNVFSAEHFQPNDASKGWDGTFNNRDLNPGVFIYKVSVQFKDGESEVRFGDLTLMR